MWKSKASTDMKLMLLFLIIEPRAWRESGRGEFYLQHGRSSTVPGRPDLMGVTAAVQDIAAAIMALVVENLEVTYSSVIVAV